MLFDKKDLKKLIVPLIIEQFLMITIGIIDTVMVAPYGESAVSGVSLVDQLNVLFTNLFSALAVGGAVTTGHCLGRKDKEGARRNTWQLLLVGFYASALVAAFLFALRAPLIRLIFGKLEPDVMKACVSYMGITSVSVVAVSVYSACTATFRAINRSKISMLTGLIMNVFHIILNVIFIHKMHMGVFGAGLSTTLSRYLCATVIMVILYKSKSQNAEDVNLSFKGYITPKVNFPMVKKILSIGIPSCMENSLFQFGKLIILNLVAGMGSIVIAANAVSNTLTMFCILPGIAINFALTSIASICVGAGEYGQALYYTKKMRNLAHLLNGMVGIVIILLLPLLLKLFDLSDETLSLTKNVVIFYAFIATLVWPPSFTPANTLRAAGDAIYTMIISVMSMWVFRVGAAYLFVYAFHLGLFGTWLAYGTDWLVRSVIFRVRLMGEKWKKV